MDKPEKIDFQQILTELHEIIGSDEKIAARLNEEFKGLSTWEDFEAKKHAILSLRTGKNKQPGKDLGDVLVWLYWSIVQKQEG